jgi:hypothetical protein
MTEEGALLRELGDALDDLRVRFPYTLGVPASEMIDAVLRVRAGDATS